MKLLILCVFLICSFASISAEKKLKHKFNDNVPFDLMNNMQNWIMFRKPGDSMDFAGGKLYRIDEGARFVDAMGITVVIPKERPDYNYIANKSPVLAKYWGEKYGFKPLPLDYEYDNKTHVDDNLSYFDSIVRALKILREKEAETRAKISGHPGVKKDFSCANIGIEVEESALAEIKNLCEELNKSGIDHQTLFKKLVKIKSDLDARGKNDLVFPAEDQKFNKDFSPFIFRLKN